MATMQGVLYPNGKFTIGFIPPPQKSESDIRYDKEQDRTEVLYSRWVWNYGRKEKKDFRAISHQLGADRLVKGSELSRKRKKYGKRGITRLGKRVVENASYLLQRKVGRKRCGFVTCTVPPMPKTYEVAIAQNWGEVVRRFFQKVKRQLDKKNAPNWVVGVTEIQEKRYRKTGSIALHLHFAYPCRRKNRGTAWYIPAKKFRKFWKDSILEVLNKAELIPPEEVDFNASIDAQVVKKSVSGYLGKYMSKGTKSVKAVINEGREEELPSQWWFASKLAKQKYKSSLVHFDDKKSKFLFYCGEQLIEEGLLSYFSYVEVLIHDADRIMGAVGVITEKFRKRLTG